VTISSGGTLTENGVAAMSFAGSLTNSGTYTASTGVHTFTGPGNSFTGTISIPSITISAAGVYTNNNALTVATALSVAGALTNAGTVTATTALTGAGGLTNSATGTLNIGGTSTIT